MKKKYKKNKQNNNRINLLIAVVFILGVVMIYRLYDLQINKHLFYNTMASNQHSIFNKLKPERGEIFIKNESDEEKLYPFAENKKFALVYAIPKDIKSKYNRSKTIENLAQKLYLAFDQENVKKEVDDLIKQEEQKRFKKELMFLSNLQIQNEGEMEVKKNEIIKKYENLKFDAEYQEAINIKKQEEIKLRKEKIIKKYLDILNKKNDPYEPIKKKVDEDGLKKLYSALLSNENEKINPDDLIFDNEKIFLKNDDQKKPIIFNGISYVMMVYRYYPENNLGSHILGFVSNEDIEQKGKYGLEGFFNDELSGEYGSIKTEQSAQRNIIIVNNREYIKPKNGRNLILTINHSIQFTACEELNKTAMMYGADKGSVIVMEPFTGAIIAMCSWPDFNPNNYQNIEDIKIFNNPSIFDQYEPGSVFKSITIVAALNDGKITPQTTYEDKGQIMIEGWPKPIKNSDYETHGGYGIVNMNTVLEQSLNTGAIFAMKQIGFNIFSDYVKKFGFGEKTGIELETESFGNINNLTADYIKPIDAAVASFGQGISVTPLQLITAYAAIANGGILMKPYVVEKIIHSNGGQSITKPQQRRRVISEKSSALVSGMLANVIENGHAKKAGVKNYYIAGKTGTAQVASLEKRGYGDQTIHTFIGFAPVDDPKFVMLVKLDNLKNIKYAADSAAPLFGKIAKFILDYYQVPARAY